LARGILPAEYGGVVGGQVNTISKSGTNNIHGTLFENYQSHALNARDPFVAARTASGAGIPKPRIVFNQFGGTLGAPIIKDRVFGFVAYEGYRESASRRVNGTVPTPAFRSEILSALPYPETQILMDVLPQPNVPINDDVGRFEGIRSATSRENHFVGKGDLRITPLSNLAVTYTRMRPFGLDPSYYVDGANDRTYAYVQDRVSASFTTGRATWMSETRFGWNFNDMARLDQFFTRRDPSNATEIAPWDRSIPRISIGGASGFGVGGAEIWDMNGTTYSVEEKISRHLGKHTLKFGGRYGFNGGFRSNPENPSFGFQSKADFLSNVPSAVTPTFGSPPFKSRMHDFGLFVQDDWRATAKLTLNLGLRYDFYGKNVSEPTTEIPVGFYNLTPPTDWPSFNFEPARDPKDPYENDAWANLGPRFGFAYNIDGQGKTVVRGGFGVLFSPQMPGVVRQAVAHPVVPFRVAFSLAEARDLGLRFPAYTDQMRQIVESRASATDVRFPFSAINPGLQNPYAMHYQFNVQRSLTSSMMIETGYVGVRGVKFLLHRRPNLPDRLTGERPNPNIIFGGYYVDNSQNTSYNALQTSLRKRFAGGIAFDVHHTWSQSLSITGGDIGAYYGSDNDNNNIQEFFNPRADRGPNPGDARHRLIADVVYELPRLRNAHGLIRHTLGGWEVSGIFTARTGERVVVTQNCASDWHCRPDYIGGQTVLSGWEQNSTSRCTVGARCTLQYLNRDAFALVPVDAGTRIAVRPGNLGMGALRNPGTWSTDISLAKNFRLTERVSLQFRTDMFNATNHVNYNGPSSNLNSATFGEINGAGGMRVVQLNAKLRW
ncbi:MAG: TonB-dependent receptor domain-containing protein, partial [Bryobacteraceae bacterium]